jgi:hypothetical protein
MTNLQVQGSPEHIAQQYSSSMDSVRLINTLRAKPVQTADEIDRISRNQEHLRIMIAKDFWTTEDLTPLQDAVAE